MAKRFIECKECKKKATATYKQINDLEVFEIEACAGCPELSKRLYKANDNDLEEISRVYEGICCDHCRTKGLDIIEGNLLGCSDCYQIFKDLILKRLKTNDWIPSPIYSIFSHSQNSSLHKGKSPFETSDIKLSHRLAHLHEALNEALKIENYEQAAWIRDRIKNLKQEAPNGESESK